MFEAFVTLVVGLPLFFIQIMRDEEKKVFINDILLALFIIALLIIVDKM